MKVILTKGMNGEKVQQISSSKTINDALAAVHKWKDEHKSEYKVESYDRLIFKKDQNKILIDFGDYSYFITIEVGVKNWPRIKKMFLR